MLKVLIVGGPVEQYIDKCLKSLTTQHYLGWEAQVVLDPFNDKSYEKAVAWQNNKIKVTLNPTRLTALPNFKKAIELLKPDDDDVIVTLDADDWFFDENALSIVASYYEKNPDILVTHGSWVPYPFSDFSNNNVPYTEEEFKIGLRNVPWHGSHLRTFKYKVWKLIKDEDLRDEKGLYFESAWDLAMMWPMLEMAGYGRVKFIPEKLYTYNLENPNSDARLRIEQQMSYADYIAKKVPYERIGNYKQAIKKSKGQKKVVLSITTYNRLNYLKKCIETWSEYRNKDYTWYLVIADDGSDDGTIEYLKKLNIQNVHKHIILNKRTGVHYQTNKILKYCSELDFDYGFKIDDDVVFLSKNWDNIYISAIEATGYDHLCFLDVVWYKEYGKGKYRLEPLLSKDERLQSYVLPEVKEFQGAFWTFTKRVIDSVGYFDIVRFGFRGLGHIDYTYRCARAGFNDIDKIYDSLNSEKYIALIKDKYVTALKTDVAVSFNTTQILSYKGDLLNRVDRIHIDYVDDPLMIGNIINKGEIQTKDSISFVIPPDKEIEDVDYLGIWLSVLKEKGYNVQILKYREDMNYDEDTLADGTKVYIVNEYSLNNFNRVTVDSLVLIGYSMASIIGINSIRKIVILGDEDLIGSIPDTRSYPHIEFTTTSNIVKEYLHKKINHSIRLIKGTEDILDLFLYRSPLYLRDK